LNVFGKSKPKGINITNIFNRKKFKAREKVPEEKTAEQNLIITPEPQDVSSSPLSQKDLSNDSLRTIQQPESHEPSPAKSSAQPQNLETNNVVEPTPKRPELGGTETPKLSAEKNQSITHPDPRQSSLAQELRAQNRDFMIIKDQPQEIKWTPDPSNPNKAHFEFSFDGEKTDRISSEFKSIGGLKCRQLEVKPDLGEGKDVGFSFAAFDQDGNRVSAKDPIYLDVDYENGKLVKCSVSGRGVDEKSIKLGKDEDPLTIERDGKTYSLGITCGQYKQFKEMERQAELAKSQDQAQDIQRSLGAPDKTRQPELQKPEPQQEITPPKTPDPKVEQEELQRRNAAATKIQAAYRGMKGRQAAKQPEIKAVSSETAAPKSTPSPKAIPENIAILLKEAEQSLQTAGQSINDLKAKRTNIFNTLDNRLNEERSDSQREQDGKTHQSLKRDEVKIIRSDRQHDMLIDMLAGLKDRINNPDNYRPENLNTYIQEGLKNLKTNAERLEKTNQELIQKYDNISKELSTGPAIKPVAKEQGPSEQAKKDLAAAINTPLPKDLDFEDKSKPIAIPQSPSTPSGKRKKEDATLDSTGSPKAEEPLAKIDATQQPESSEQAKKDLAAAINTPLPKDLEYKLQTIDTPQSPGTPSGKRTKEDATLDSTGSPKAEEPLTKIDATQQPESSEQAKKDLAAAINTPLPENLEDKLKTIDTPQSPGTPSGKRTKEDATLDSTGSPKAEESLAKIDATQQPESSEQAKKDLAAAINTPLPNDLKERSKAIATSKDNTKASPVEKIDINQVDENGRTALHRIAINDQDLAARLIKEALQKGADPNIRDNQDKTPLEYAVAKGNSRTVKALLDGGSQPFDAQGQPLKIQNSVGAVQENINKNLEKAQQKALEQQPTP